MTSSNTILRHGLFAIVVAAAPVIAANDSAATQPAQRAAVAGGTGGAATDADPFPAATPTNVVKVTRAIFPAVVRIDVAKSVDEKGHETIERGIGSGVIFDADGLILTNYHVAGRGAEIYVTLFSKERVRARLVGDDHWTDLAVIQLDMKDVRSRNLSFSVAELGASDTLVPGQDVMAIGTPYGLARTLTIGTVSNAERTLENVTPIDGFETGGYSNWVQMDVPINPGNSGGPLVDLNGKIVGINTRGGAQNLNFAIPIDTAKTVIASILRTSSAEHPGVMVRADLGLELQPLQGLEAFYKLDVDRGVLIDSVDHFSAAEQAGVRSQDILVAINGEPTNVRFPEELASVMQRIAALPTGKVASLSMLRGGQPITLTATPRPLLSIKGEPHKFSTWGMSAREITPAYANADQLDRDGGLVVTVIVPDSPASRAGLLPGDVIDAVDGKTLDAGNIATASSRPASQEPVMLSVRRARGTRNVLLRPTTQPQPD